MTDESDSSRHTQRNFAAAVLHELRTPLSALVSEVEIALRRQRAPEAYREVLTRVAEQAAELVELTRDLALFVDPDALRQTAEATTDLDGLLERLSIRVDRRLVNIIATPPNIRVTGDEVLLARALHLLLGHASRHRGPGSPVRLRPVADPDVAPETSVELHIEASAPGFSREAWYYLLDGDAEPESPGHPALMSLTTAAHIVRMSGGAVDVDGPEGLVRVRIRLCRVNG